MAGGADSLLLGKTSSMSGVTQSAADLYVHTTLANVYPRAVYIPLSAVGSILPPFISFKFRQVVGSGTARITAHLTRNFK
jgi:hypothetical protein